LAGPVGKKITVPPYVVTAISFFKEAAFAASPNPSSILWGIHFCIYSVVRYHFPPKSPCTCRRECDKIIPMIRDFAHYNQNSQNASLKLPKAILSTSRNQAIRQSGNQAIRQSGNQAIRQSGNQAIRQSGNQAIRQLYT
jgi:hypothetical protein